MASSRDDFIIAIRSAFLKKSTQQKFSLLTLVFISIFIIILSSFDFRVIRYLKIGINEIVYRSSFVVSIPENFIKNTFIEITDYSTFFKDYKKNRKELEDLKSINISSEIIQFENKELNEKWSKLIKIRDIGGLKTVKAEGDEFIKQNYRTMEVDELGFGSVTPVRLPVEDGPSAHAEAPLVELIVCTLVARAVDAKVHALREILLGEEPLHKCIIRATQSVDIHQHHARVTQLQAAPVTHQRSKVAARFGAHRKVLGRRHAKVGDANIAREDAVDICIQNVWIVKPKRSDVDAQVRGDRLVVGSVQRAGPRVVPKRSSEAESTHKPRAPLGAMIDHAHAVRFEPSVEMAARTRKDANGCEQRVVQGGEHSNLGHLVVARRAARHERAARVPPPQDGPQLCFQFIPLSLVFLFLLPSFSRCYFCFQYIVFE